MSAPPNKTALPDHLLAGYQAFAATRLRDEQARFKELAEKGQQP